jgi:hypothetical protein
MNGDFLLDVAYFDLNGDRKNEAIAYIFGPDVSG